MSYKVEWDYLYVYWYKHIYKYIVYYMNCMYNIVIWEREMEIEERIKKEGLDT